MAPTNNASSFQWKPALFLGFIAFLFYSNTLTHDYALDDSGAITNNLFVQKGLAGIPDILAVDLWHFDNVNLGYYRPLSLITFAIEHEFFGLNPSISHLGNVLLFSLIVLMLFVFLQLLFFEFNVLIPFFISLLFAAHPIHTEVVANIKSRDELLSFLHILITFIFLLKYVKSDKKIWLLLSVPSFYLALLSKETAMVSLALAPFILFYKNKSISKSIYISTGLLIIIAGLFLFQKQMLMGTLTGAVPEDIINYPYLELNTRIATSFVIFVRCLWLLIFPFNLKYDYSYNSIPGSDWQSPMTYLGFLLFIGILYLIFQNRNKNQHYSIAGILFLFTLAPAFGFILLRGGIMAERFLFAPSLGFIVWLVFALAKSFHFSTKEVPGFSWTKNFKNSFSYLILFIALVFAGKTYSRNFSWKNNFTLFAEDIKINALSAQNHRHLGSEYINKAIKEKDEILKRDFYNKGIGELRKALRIHPTFGDAYFKLGVAHHAVYLNNDSAIYYYTKATETAPGYAVSYNNLGIIYQNLQQNELASYYYNKAIEVNPNFPDSKTHAANLKAQTGLDVHIFPSTINLDSLQENTVKKDDLFYYNLGTLYATKGDYTTAIVHLKQALQLNPNNQDVLVNLANCFGIQNKFEESVYYNLQVLKLNPRNARGLQNLMVSYDKMGEKKKADEVRKKLSEVVGN